MLRRHLGSGDIVQKASPRGLEVIAGGAKQRVGSLLDQGVAKTESLARFQRRPGRRSTPIRTCSWRQLVASVCWGPIALRAVWVDESNSLAGGAEADRRVLRLGRDNSSISFCRFPRDEEFDGLRLLSSAWFPIPDEKDRGPVQSLSSGRSSVVKNVPIWSSTIRLRFPQSTEGCMSALQGPFRRPASSL